VCHIEPHWGQAVVDTLATLDAFDFRDSAVLADPYPTYARLREIPGLPRTDHQGWIVSRHASVSALLHDRRLGSSPLNTALYSDLPPEAQEAVEPFRDGMSRNMLFQDAPEHTRLRRLVSQAFTPRRIEMLRGTIAEITNDLLAGRAAGDRFDVIHDLAFRLPARVIASMMGMPWDDLDDLKHWNDAGAEFLGNALTTDDPIGLSRGAGQAFAAMRTYFGALVEQHRAAPGDDLICALLAIEEQGDGLTHDELLSTCTLLFAAGHETTTNLIGNGLLALLRHPDQLALWHAEPSLGPVAVEELLRYDSPIQFIHRVALERVEVEGQPIEDGELVTLLLASGNRDAAVFPDPDRLDLRRRPRHYLSFGTGPHACLGAFLARLEGEIALTTLIGQFPGMTLEDEPLTWHPNPIFRGLERLPVIL
jgi:cytochrome P450